MARLSPERFGSLPQPYGSDILNVCPKQTFLSRSALLDAEAHISAQPPEAE